MLTTTIALRDDAPEVRLEAYVLKNSLGFQMGYRRPAVSICPGGAYLRTSDREAEPVALRFLAQGYHAFVLCYWYVPYSRSQCWIWRQPSSWYDRVPTNGLWIPTRLP